MDSDVEELPLAFGPSRGTVQYIRRTHHLRRPPPRVRAGSGPEDLRKRESSNEGGTEISRG